MKANPVFTCDLRMLAVSPKRESCLSGQALRWLENMAGSLVFLYVRGGGGGWFYPTAVRGGVLRGYALRGGKWSFARIALGRVAAFY